MGLGLVVLEEDRSSLQLAEVGKEDLLPAVADVVQVACPSVGPVELPSGDGVMEE